MTYLKEWLEAAGSGAFFLGSVFALAFLFGGKRDTWDYLFGSFFSFFVFLFFSFLFFWCKSFREGIVAACNGAGMRGKRENRERGERKKKRRTYGWLDVGTLLDETATCHGQRQGGEKDIKELHDEDEMGSSFLLY